MSRVLSSLVVSAEVVGGSYQQQQQLGAISLPHNEKSKNRNKAKRGGGVDLRDASHQNVNVQSKLQER